MSRAWNAGQSVQSSPPRVRQRVGVPRRGGGGLCRSLGVVLLAGVCSATAHAVCSVPEITDMPITLGIETHGHKIGGMGIVTMAEGGGAVPAAWTLTLLSPGGLALFTARGSFNDRDPEPPVGIETGLDAWKPWLEKLPLGRDLRTAFSTNGDRTECAGGTTRTRAHTFSDALTGWVRRWRGPGGPVRAEITADRVILHDKLRGYTLTIVAPGRPLPTPAPVYGPQAPAAPGSP